jgi:hypothetical protein
VARILRAEKEVTADLQVEVRLDGRPVARVSRRVEGTLVDALAGRGKVEVYDLDPCGRVKEGGPRYDV